MDAINPTAIWAQLFGHSKRRSEFPWNAENIERLKVLIAGKFSAGEIAAQLGTGRNSVLGKIHRLGLSMPNRPGSAHTRPKPKPKADHWTGFPKRKSPDRKPPMTAQLQDGPVVPLNISFEDLQTGQCKYPYGDTAPFLFCGLPSEGPWCTSHLSVCFTGRSHGWERPDQTYRLRKRMPSKHVLDSNDLPTAEQLPDVA